MAVRRERVELDLDDRLTPGLARAAVAARLLDHELASLGGTSTKTGRDLDAPTRGSDKFTQSANRSGPAIDKYSGRLRTLGEVAFTLGPALIPLGASTIPVLTASIAGLGAAAGGIGVTVLAMHGLGDAIKAIDAYRLEPTVQNLQALRIEQEKLGPTGAEFTRYLTNLEPALRDLQMTARDGLFPGIEDGINALLTRAPQVTRIISELSTGMGNLARDAGQNLGGPKFTAFFDYLESDAKPTLEAFGRSAGNVALGVANMLVAFAPLSRDFTGGLEGATKAFADWSAGLDQNRSFQNFVAYVRESGPQAVALLSALAEALIGLLHAAAPLGKIALPALTGIARAFAAIANSPIGAPLYTAIAALIAFNRIASVTSKANTSLQTSFKKLGSETQTTSQKLSLLGARGGVIFAGAAAVGMLADSINRIDPSNLDRSLTALKFGDVTDTVTKVIDSLQQLNSPLNKVDLGEIVTVGGLFGDSSLDKFANNVDQVDQSLAQLVESGNVDEAATLFQKISDLAAAKGVNPADTAARFDAYSQALKNVASESSAASGATDEFGNSVKGTAGAMDDGTGAAQRFSDALSNLNGWLDKRSAIRDYRDGIVGLSKALKNGFQPKDAETLDAVGRNIAQVASLIKDRGLRADFLAGARASLQDLADKSGPKARQQVEQLIGALDRYGLTKPPKPKLGVDDKATPTLDELGIKLRRTDQTTAKPKVSVDPGNSLSILGSIAHLLGSLHSKTIDVTVNRLGGVTSSAGGHSVPSPTADGGTVPRSGLGYADRYHYLLADAEEVTSNRYGQADHFRATLKAINAWRPGMANGGTAGRWAKNYDGGYMTDIRGHGGRGGRNDVSDAIQILVAPIWSAANLLKALNKELERQQKAYDKAKSVRDEAVSRRDSISSSIQSGLSSGSIWDASSGSVWAAGAHGANDPASALAALQERKARAQRLVVAINTLKQKGVTGPALLEIIGSGDVERAEAMASLDIGSLSSFAVALNDTNTQLAAAGLAGGNAVEGDNIRSANKRLDRLHDDLQAVKHAINQANADNKHAQDKNAQDVKNGVNGAAASGHKRGKR